MKGVSIIYGWIKFTHIPYSPSSIVAVLVMPLTLRHLIERKIISLEKTSEIANQFFGERFDLETFWSGRPDLLLEVFQKDSHRLEKVIIGEVKHTSNTRYAMTGLRELIGYMDFVRERNGRFLTESPLDLQGILFVDNVVVREPYISNVMVINHSFKN